MFMRLSEHQLEKTLLVIVAATLELYKVFSVVRGNTLSRLKLKRAAYRAYIMYVVLALVSIMASYGFTLTVTNRSIQVANSSTINLQIENSKAIQAQYEASIKITEESIATNQARLKALPDDFVTAARTLNDTITKQSASLADLQATLAAEKASEVALQIQSLEALASSTTTTSMFKLMAEGFKFLFPKITETSLMLALLLLISVLIEIGIISTSPAIPIDRRHLKHFLDEETAARAEELLAIAQGKKEKAQKKSFIAKIAQKIMIWKQDLNTLKDPVVATPVVAEEKKVEKENIPEAVPMRKIPPHHIEEKEVESAVHHEKVEAHTAAPVYVPTPIVQPAPEPVARTIIQEVEETPPAEAVPTRAVAPSRGPQYNSEAKVYRFGKTTEAVKDLFVNFVHALFNTENSSGELNTLDKAAALAGVPMNTASTFLARLLDIKGSRGVTLLERHKDGSLHPNYPEGYIITYATAESNRERGK